MIDEPFLRRPALTVHQELGVFFVTTMKARELLQLCYSDRLEAVENVGTDGYELRGTQRTLDDARLRSIADYISRIDSSFPNTIILAANFRQEDGLIEEDDAVRWRIETAAGGERALIIPTRAKLAAVIDGQHRLFAYTKTSPNRLENDLVCAVFIDLPKAMQAGLFATINSTQKPVDRSLTFELFGYNISEEAAQQWSPDKLAVYLTRRLGADLESPLRGRITVAPEHDFEIPRGLGRPWRISTAAVVTGITKLFSGNPKRDANFLLSGRRRLRSELTGEFNDQSPLRPLYYETNDQLIYLMVRNYLNACDMVFWRHAPETSFIFRTIGVTALFKILRAIAPRALKSRKVSVDYFADLLMPAKNIDFSLPQYSGSSGKGEGAIRHAIEAVIKRPDPTIEQA